MRNRWAGTRSWCGCLAQPQPLRVPANLGFRLLALGKAVHVHVSPRPHEAPDLVLCFASFASGGFCSAASGFSLQKVPADPLLCEAASRTPHFCSLASLELTLFGGADWWAPQCVAHHGPRFTLGVRCCVHTGQPQGSAFRMFRIPVSSYVWRIMEK